MTIEYLPVEHTSSYRYLLVHTPVLASTVAAALVREGVDFAYTKETTERGLFTYHVRFYRQVQRVGNIVGKLKKA